MAPETETEIKLVVGGAFLGFFVLILGTAYFFPAQGSNAPRRALTTHQASLKVPKVLTVRKLLDALAPLDPELPVEMVTRHETWPAGGVEVQTHHGRAMAVIFSDEPERCKKD